MWPFFYLLAVHWMADLVLQTHWQASNKSKNWNALARHVGVYTLVLGAASLVLWINWYVAVMFALLNGALHFATDYLTSRWTSRLFAPAMRDTVKVINFTETYRHAPTEVDLRLMEVDPARHWHNFFVVIGLDQLIHQATLAATLALFLM